MVSVVGRPTPFAVSVPSIYCPVYMTTIFLRLTRFFGADEHLTSTHRRLEPICLCCSSRRGGLVLGFHAIALWIFGLKWCARTYSSVAPVSRLLAVVLPVIVSQLCCLNSLCKSPCSLLSLLWVSAYVCCERSCPCSTPTCQFIPGLTARACT